MGVFAFIQFVKSPNLFIYFHIRNVISNMIRNSYYKYDLQHHLFACTGYEVAEQFAEDSAHSQSCSFLILFSDFFSFFLSEGPKQTDIIKDGVLPTTGLAALSTGISFESYILKELIPTRELSAKYSLLSSTDVSSSQFLNFGVHDPAQIVWGKTSISYMPIQTPVAIPGFLFPSRAERTSFIISSFMTDSIFPTESLFENNKTISLSTTPMSSVITGIPGADIKLNRHSLLSHGFLLTTASTSAPPIVSRGAQEDIEG